MPPKAKLSQKEIIQAAIAIVREEGDAALNARALAKRLGTSTQPIFTHYSSMDRLRQDVIGEAQRLYQDYLDREMSSGRYPPYKASGMGYIRFAMEEKELFKLLFMRDRTGETITDGMEEMAPIIRLIHEKLGLSLEQARLFHLEMWLYVHGAAAMLATNYLPWDLEDVSAMLTDAFEGLLARYKQKSQNGGSEVDG